jgi:DNA-binding NarL/FixJ family response regulator
MEQAHCADMNDPITVLIAEDDAPFRQALCAWLAGADGVRVVGEARDESEALELARARRPVVILLAANFLHSRGSQQAAPIGELYPGSKVIVLSDADQERVVLEALRKGAMGYLVKEESQPHQVVEAVCAAGRGEAILTPRMAGWILDEMV